MTSYVQLRSASELTGAMRDAGVGVRALAAKVGRSPAAISHLRTGRNKGVDLAAANKIATELGVPTRRLFAVEELEALLAPAGGAR